MKIFSYKIISSFLAILVLLSSSFIIIDTHYCSGKAVDSSIIGRARTCMVDMEPCSVEGSSSISESECCTNAINFKFSEVFENIDLKKTDIKHQYFTSLVFKRSVETSQLTDKRNFTPTNYIIPLITRHIYILDESFLL